MQYLGVDLEEDQLNVQTYGNDKRANSPEFQKLGTPIDPENHSAWRTKLSSSQKNILAYSRKGPRAVRLL